MDGIIFVYTVCLVGNRWENDEFERSWTELVRLVGKIWQNDEIERS